MKQTIRVFSLSLALMFAAASAFAASPWTQEADYAGQTSQKLIFGLKNTLGGWTEIVTETAEADNAAAGFMKGLGNAVVYTVGGALHLGTFFIPVDIPLPDDGVDF